MKRLHIGISTVVLLILLNTIGFAQFVPVSVQRINIDEGNTSQTGADILYTDQGNIVIAWGDRRHNYSMHDAYMRISTDGGQSFGEEIQVNDINGQIRAGGEEKVGVAQDLSDDLIFYWTDMRNGGNNGDIFCRIRFADGRFSDVIRLNDDQTSNYQLLPHINRIGQSDTLLSAWLDFRVCQSCPEVRTTMSIDGGLSWSANIRADIQGEDDEPCECCHPWIVDGSEGQILVAFRNDLSNIRDIYVARANDDFTRFSPPVRASFGNWQINGCPTTGPVLIQHSSGVWICAYADGRNGTYGIYTSRSLDDGYEFQDETTVADNGRSQNFPALLELIDGRLLIAYQQSREDYQGLRIMAAISEDAGHSWGDIFEISDSEASIKLNVGLAAGDDGNVFAVWVDTRRDAGDIYFAILSEATPAEERQQNLPQSPVLRGSYPNPFNATTIISFSLPEPQQVTLTVYNLLGREVRTLMDEYGQAGINHITFDASDLASGLYFYRLQAGESVESRRMVLLK